MYDNFPLVTFSKNVDPAVNKPIEVVKQASPIAAPINATPKVPRILFAMNTNSAVLVIPESTKLTVCAPINVKPP